jgi:hypothetical protein
LYLISERRLTMPWGFENGNWMCPTSEYAATRLVKKIAVKMRTRLVDSQTRLDVRTRPAEPVRAMFIFRYLWSQKNFSLKQPAF